MNLSTRTKGKHSNTTNDFVKQKQKENSQKQQKHLMLQIHTNSINHVSPRNITYNSESAPI